jgi:hypothetical protein
MGIGVLVAAATLAAALVWVRPASAEEPGLSPKGKGITGGALLGGELVMAVEAAFGVKPGWAYLVGGLGGAAAGGAGGYFAEKGSDPRPSYWLLAGGMAMIIPTTVAVLQATSYKAPADYQEDRPGKGTAPVAEPPRPAPAAPPAAPGAPPPPAEPGKPAVQLDRSLHRTATVRPPVPMSLVDLDGSSVRLGVPAVEIRPMYSVAELRRFGLEQQTEVRLPLFQATF